MVVATRSSSNSPVKKRSADTTEATTNPQRQDLKHFILPKDISSEARFLLLQNPCDGNTQRFLFCPEKGLFHFSGISAPTADPRSLLFAPCDPETLQTNPTEDESQSERLLSKGYISKGADFYVAAPFDVAFILIPLILPAKPTAAKALFQPIDDLFEQRKQDDKELRYLLERGRPVVENAMSRICDTLEAGGEQMYRPSEEKALRMIVQKVKNAVNRGLPASVLEKFVKRALEAPILSVKREETVTTTQTVPLSVEEDDSALDSLDSQSSAASTAHSTIFSEASTTSSISTAVDEPTSKELFELQKQWVTLDFILASYLPEAIADRLKARFESGDSLINFAALKDHLRNLDGLKAEALASRSMSDFSRKRGLEDDEALELRVEKKRKQEEEERKRKLGESRGVRELKKVNVSGMKKMSDFFAKKPATTVP
ncbi:uncharacterized protein PV07_09731 [Cladophialophora immunda]|uniref:Ribonuclease H2 subunit B n=1 Tax=Cladophialophora immunda TaxID=569365 RepID=A0A0D1Z8N4_9EURO|nr:uncharacterized protein PV07_09731 [Cladophialophora immunda]KIW23991.1 hypothetical protein PV07_09731 [Cladophialophora immunda]